MRFRLAEFEDGDAMVRAAKQLRAEGYERLETYTPYPVEGLDEVVPNRAPGVSRWILGAGLIGGTTGVVVQWYCNAFDYPLNVGSRPLLSFPAWVPITFELTVLFGGLTGFVWFLLSAPLLRLHNPIDRFPGIERASQDRHFLAIDGGDPRFDPRRTEEVLTKHGALRIVDEEGA